MQIEKDEFIVEKWAYAILAGMIGMAAASSPNGISPNTGFAICFFMTFLGLIVLETFAQKVRVRKFKNYGLLQDNAHSSSSLTNSKDQFYPLVLAFVFALIFWLIPSDIRGQLALRLLDGLEKGRLWGFLLAVLFAWGWKYHVKRTRRIAHDEIVRIIAERNELQQRSLGTLIQEQEASNRQ